MRFKTKWEKLVIATIGISIGVFLVGTGKVEAALQANSTTHNKPEKANGATWIQSIRKMEMTGQTMGLNEKLNTDLTTDGDSNNIDVHMMRTTEFGAMAILSTSGFGNPGKLQESTIKSTTGNVTGVYVTGSRWEWTAGVNSDGTAGKNKRYYDLYTNKQASAKVGDALGLATYTDNPGCSGWHSAWGSYWCNYTNEGFRRGGERGIFSFQGSSNGGGSWTAYDYVCRGVAVVGTGI